MATNEYRISEPHWGGQDPHSPTTGDHARLAGMGQHAPSERMIRAQQLGAIPMRAQKVVSPLGDIRPFVAEIRADYGARSGHALGRIVGGVAGGVLGYALATHALQQRRNRG